MTYKNDLLRNNYTLEQAELIQIKYKRFIKRLKVAENFIDTRTIKVITGVDISYYSKKDGEYGVACAVNWDIVNKKMEEVTFENDNIKFPYKPGFLGFRESKLLSRVILKLKKTPDLILCDGHGIIHPRRFGEAVHLGFALNLPTVGVAKNSFVGYSNWGEIKRFKGNKTPVWAKKPGSLISKISNELLGYAVCLKNNSKPIFISKGYKVNLDLAVALCLATTKDHRQPEPIYLADHLSRVKAQECID
ncbi:MAG: endonuclease V [Promethearchaeota archaeon]|jgi:deoxyribonuclease V